MQRSSFPPATILQAAAFPRVLGERRSLLRAFPRNVPTRSLFRDCTGRRSLSLFPLFYLFSTSNSLTRLPSSHRGALANWSSTSDGRFISNGRSFRVFEVIVYLTQPTRISFRLLPFFVGPFPLWATSFIGGRAVTKVTSSDLRPPFAVRLPKRYPLRHLPHG